jgi:lipopolysaccharide export system protein LptC
MDAPAMEDPTRRPIAALAALLLGAVGPGCASSERVAQEALPPEVVLHGVRIRSYQGSAAVAVGDAARLTYDRASTGFEAHQSRVRFEDQGPGAQGPVLQGVQLSAHVLRGQLSSQRAQAHGQVTLRAGGGLVGRTEQAELDWATRTAQGTAPVQVDGPGYTLRSGGFAFDFGTEELRFVGEVQSRIGRANGDER